MQIVSLHNIMLRLIQIRKNHMKLAYSWKFKKVTDCKIAHYFWLISMLLIYLRYNS